MNPIFYIPAKTNWRIRLSKEPRFWDKDELGALQCHREYEIFLVLEGSIFFLIDKKKYPLHSGDLVFINQNIPHQAFYSAGSAHHVVHIRPKQIPNQEISARLDRFIPNGKRFAIFPADTPEGEMLRTCMLDFCEEAKEQKNAYLSFIEAGVDRMIALLRRYDVLAEPKDHLQDTKLLRLLPVFEYIEEHLDEPITLSVLSQQLHISEDHFSRLFRQLTNVSPIFYINDTRIRKAQQLLADQTMSITDISYAVGFSSPTYFDRIFRKYTHASPLQYRRQVTANE